MDKRGEKVGMGPAERLALLLNPIFTQPLSNGP